MALRTSAHEALGCRIEGRRIVGAVDLGVAVHATAALPHVGHVLAAGHAGDLRLGQARRGCEDTRLSAHGSDAACLMGRVALLAEQGRARLEHGRNQAAVRVVANAAVFGDRRMLVHERTALFCMAGVAGVVHAVALGELGTGRTMHVVAVGTGHFALGNRVVRRPVDLGALLLVAGKAELGLLGSAGQHRVTIAVRLVAGIAGHISRFVLAAGPQVALGILVVAGLANRAAIIGIHRREFADDLAKRHVGLGQLLDILGLVRMGFARAMTADAVGRALVSDKPVRRAAHVGQVFGVVAGDAERGPLGFGLGAPGRPEQSQQTKADRANCYFDFHPNPFKRNLLPRCTAMESSTKNGRDSDDPPASMRIRTYFCL